MIPAEQTISVSGTPRVYETSWDPEFQKELATGSTGIRTARISAPETSGTSVLKIAHSENKGIRRDQIMIRDKVVVGSQQTDLKTVTRQAYIVMSGSAADDRDALAALTMGLLNYLVGEGSPLVEVLAGQH
jgi:hypothetical protein